MTQGTVDRFRRWFEYEKDSAKTMASLNGVTMEGRPTPSFQKAVDLMAHLAAARLMWLYRLAVSEKPAELFPKNARLEDLPRCFREMEEAWSQYLDQLNDSELVRVFEYQSYDGARFRNTIEDILTQLFGHSLYTVARSQ